MAKVIDNMNFHQNNKSNAATSEYDIETVKLIYLGILGSREATLDKFVLNFTAFGLAELWLNKIGEYDATNPKHVELAGMRIMAQGVVGKCKPHQIDECVKLVLDEIKEGGEASADVANKFEAFVIGVLLTVRHYVLQADNCFEFGLTKETPFVTFGKRFASVAASVGMPVFGLTLQKMLGIDNGHECCNCGGCGRQNNNQMMN